MKNYFCFVCCLAALVLLPSCDNDSGGTSGGDLPVVSYDLFVGDQWATCYNVDENVVMNPFQTCVWNCATYNNSQPAYWKLTILWDAATDEHSIVDIESGPCRR